MTSNVCIDNDDGRHAGCCCGIIPSAGVFSIGAKSGRRLNVRQDSGIDACGRAFEISQGEVTQMVSDIMTTSEGPKILADFDASQKAAYPEFYGNCDARRLEGETAARQDMGQDLEKDATNDNETARVLQSKYLMCEPPSKPTKKLADPLTVAFSGETETALCKDIPGVSDQKLAQTCAEFCAPTSTPFLLGSTSYGFNHETMDSICLEPDGQVYNESFVDTCHRQGEAFNELQKTTADLISKLEALDASQLHFEAKVKEAANGMRDLIKEQAPTKVDDKAQSQKIAAVQELLKVGLEQFMGASGATQSMKDDAKEVDVAAKRLFFTLKDVRPKLIAFHKECNVLMTGVGPRQEYLLDMCSQNSKQCIGAVEGSHVGCCCGYNPITALGTDVKSNTISGLSADVFENRKEARVGESRRLSDDTASASINICGLASKLSNSKISEYKSEIEKVDTAIWSRQLQNKKAKYPTYYARCSGGKVYDPHSLTELSDAMAGSFGISVFLVGVLAHIFIE